MDLTTLMLTAGNAAMFIAGWLIGSGWRVPKLQVKPRAPWKTHDEAQEPPRRNEKPRDETMRWRA